MKVFGIIVCIACLLKGSKLVAEANNGAEILDGGIQQDSTLYFDPISEKFVDLETFAVDQQNCAIGFSFAPGVYAAGRQVELTKMLFWADDLVIGSEDNFAFCQNARVLSHAENREIKCDVFFRDDLGKGNDVMGLFGGLGQLLRCNRLDSSQLNLSQNLKSGDSKIASCDPDGIIHLSIEESRLFQSCLNRKFNLESE